MSGFFIYIPPNPENIFITTDNLSVISGIPNGSIIEFIGDSIDLANCLS